MTAARSGPPDRLASRQNPRVKRLVRLRDRRHRRREGVFVMEEPRVIARALAAGVTVREVYVCPAVAAAHPAAADLLEPLAATGVPVTEITPAVLEKVAYRDHPAGLVVVAEPPAWSLATLDLPPDALVVVLEQVEKPGNLGAVVRTASGAGVHAVLACGGGADPFGPNALRASTGAVLSVPVVETSPAEAAAWLKARGVRLVAATPDVPRLYTELDLTGPTAFLLGAEDAGLSPELRDAADAACRLPMLGAADSLNVSVTAAVLVYEARRQRDAARGGTSGERR